MKTYLPVIIAASIALLLGFGFGETPLGLFAFLIAGVLGGSAAQLAPRSSERAYWLFIVLIFGLIALAWWLITFGRLAYGLPLIFILSYLAARITMRLTRRLKV